MADHWFCSEVSREAGEPLIASASRVDAWLCLEYSGAWGRKALNESDLPQPVKAQLQAAESNIPHARVELIKQERRQPDNVIRFFVAVSAETGGALYAFSLETYEDMLSLDLARIAARDKMFDAQISQESLLLVCTNGARDHCCAKYGLPTYQATTARLGANVWQCTHLGGHRFAANMVSLPAGAYYGRIMPDDVTAISDPTRISLAHYRGRALYDKPAQAAETFVRERWGMVGLSDLTLDGVEPVSDSEWVAMFHGVGRAFRAHVRRRGAGYSIPESCGDETRKEAQIFDAVEITEVQA